MPIQDFGENFDLTKFHHARDIARDMTHELANKIRPGMVEDDAHALYKKICAKHSDRNTNNNKRNCYFLIFR